MINTNQLEQCYHAIDEINRLDPNLDAQAHNAAKSLIYGQRMTNTLSNFMDDAPMVLSIACRAQHIQRWFIPRQDFPMGRTGYLNWRRKLAEHHADLGSKVMQANGFSEAQCLQLRKILTKQGIKSDPLVQALEDVACLVFIQYYFDDFCRQHNDEKIIRVLQKTWAKMSSKGHEAAAQLKLSTQGQKLINRALAP